MKNSSVLISGAGVAGPTLAYWLYKYGFKPVIIEHAPAFRTGGYVVDFWGVGFDVAEKMGIVPALMQKGYFAKEVRLIDDHGSKLAGFDAAVFRKATKGRFVSVPRGDLAQEIYNQVKDNIETIYDDSITSLNEKSDGVEVTFAHTPERTFDLVIGADGLHSKVRELAFGAESKFETRTGYYVAAFEAKAYKHRDNDVFMMHSAPGKQVARFSLHNDATMFFFGFYDPNLPVEKPYDTQAHKRILREKFHSVGWESAEILDVMDRTNEIFFDRVSQIHLPSWSKGRVSLVGDAAFCPSLLAGEGSSLAMASSYLLAKNLYEHGGDYRAAFDLYEKQYRPLVERKQKAAFSFASSFVPKTNFGIWFRTQVVRMFGLPFVLDMFVGNSVKDNFILP